MKSMRRILSLACAISSLLVLHAHSKDTVNQPYNQQISGTALPDFFFLPLEYNHKSIKFFLKRVYNHPRYPQEFFARNQLHVTSGLGLATLSDQPRRFIKKILNLFSQTIQQIYVNPYEFAQTCEKLIGHTRRYCHASAEKTQAIESIKSCIGNRLVDDFQNFKDHPEATLNDLAQEIYEMTSLQDGKDLSVRELQHEVHYFLARGFMNLIWSPADQVDTWKIVKILAGQLEKMVEYGIIDGDMLDDLLWTLLKRYCYFISLTAGELSPAFFETVRNDLKNESLALWTLEEREAYITTKYEYLQNTLLEGEVTAQVRASGLYIPTIR